MAQNNWSLEDYKKYIESNKRSKKSKYGAKKTSVDGHTFDSKKEAEYYQELKLKLRAKAIKGFCLQSIFILAPDLKYRPDFIVFNEDGTYEIIDVKRI